MKCQDDPPSFNLSPTTGPHYGNLGAFPAQRPSLPPPFLPLACTPFQNMGSIHRLLRSPISHKAHTCAAHKGFVAHLMAPHRDPVR